MRTLIAIPCMDQVAAPFAHSLATLEKTGECVISMNIGSLVFDARNQLTKQALANECDYIVWLDSDMIFPPDLIPRLLARAEDGNDIITGIYFHRRAPFGPVLYKKLRKGEPAEKYNDYPEDSFFEVEGAGFGACLVKTSVMEDVALNYGTWFSPLEGYGEDVSFCMRARELGYKIMCDSSIKCGHVGQVTVDENVYKENFREALIKNAGNSETGASNNNDGV